MSRDPFVVLGISGSSTATEVRDAWRRAIIGAHPDHGGSSEAVQRLNWARDMALELVGRDDRLDVAQVEVFEHQVARDIPSFSVAALPVDAFESLRVVASQLGTIIDEDEPYVLEFTLDESSQGADRTPWCRCEVLPEAGASLVLLTVAAPRGFDDMAMERLRDNIITRINQLDGR